MINDRSRRRCGLLLSSALVLTPNIDFGRQSSIVTDAYVMPPKRNTRRFRSFATILHEVNGIAVQDINHSSFHNVGYDANSIIDFYDRRPWEIGLRLNMLGLPLLGKASFDVHQIPGTFLPYFAHISCR
jgi:hypothetical protein